MNGTQIFVTSGIFLCRMWTAVAQAADGQEVPRATAGMEALAAAERTGAEDEQSVLGSRFTVSARLDVRSPHELAPHSVKPFDTVRSGDKFSLSVWVDQPVFLYVIGYRARGWSKLLFSRSSPVEQTERVHLPGPEKTYSFDEQTGLEQFYVYASRTPIDEETCKQLRVACGSSQGIRTRGGDLPPPPPPPPPSRLQRSPDGFAKVVSDNGSFVLSAMGDTTKSALLYLTVNHLR